LPAGRSDPLSILDLGAGTGQLAAKAWTYLGRMSSDPLPPASFHFVDNNPPAFGRSFGLTRDRSGVTHVEWTTADYRSLADDDKWLNRCGPFDWVFLCRVLDNTSNFMVESIDGIRAEKTEISANILPHRCLAPRRQPEGIRRLLISTSRKHACGGTIFPQFSLRDYFAAILSLQRRDVCPVGEDVWYLPVRRFNPASLITPRGRSLLAQLMKVSRSLVIEDVDVRPEHLTQHREQFRLSGSAAIFCTGNGFATEANYFVLTSPDAAQYIRGDRLW